MKRIHGEMENIRRAVGFTGDLPAYFEHLRTDPRYVPESKEWLLAEYRKLLEKTDEKLPLLFGKLPKARWDLKEIEEYRAEAAPAADQLPPPDDGSRPGYFYVNTYQLETRPKYTMSALAFHEAVPGHHLQIALQQEREGIPDFLRHEGFTAYVEGWALYSESLPREVGLATDPLSEFGRLTFEAWRAARLVVDTGIHSMDWSRQQAIDYMTANTAIRPHDIESEVDRYIAWPAQALAYKLGELRFANCVATPKNREATPSTFASSTISSWAPALFPWTSSTLAYVRATVLLLPIARVASGHFVIRRFALPERPRLSGSDPRGAPR